MNKRKRKKQFKKQFGFNPSKASKTINNLSDFIQVLVDGVANMFKVIIKFMEEFPQRVRDMPEEEFQNILNAPDLSEENKKLLMKLRNKGGD